MEPDYSKYTAEELVDVYNNIDRDSYPDRFKRIQDEIEARKSTVGFVRDDDKIGLESYDEPDPEIPVRNVDADGNYIPNIVTIEQRLISTVTALGLTGYVAYGLYIDEIFVPSKNGGVYFSGPSIWFIAAAILCLCLESISKVVDHYDKRDNEMRYYYLRKILSFLTVGLVIAAVIVKIKFE